MIRGVEFLRFCLKDNIMMALPHHQKNEGTTATGLWLSPPDKTKPYKKKCIFKNHLTDNNCNKTVCPLYPKLSCRKFTYTTNADKYVPRCEHLLNQTRCYPSSDLRCNPFQTPLKEIVAQEIRLCAEERCSNYSLRYIFNNFCKCDMNTLRGLLPSYQGYNNICCKRTNYSRKLADTIDAEKLQMFQKKLAEAVDKTKRSYASDPYGIHGSLPVQSKCKSLPSYQVQLSKDSSPTAETSYLFRNQLMEMAKRKFEENKDLIVTEFNVSVEEFQNTELLTQFDNSNKQEGPNASILEHEQLMANKVLSENEETIYKPDYIPPVFDIHEADGTTSITIPRKGLKMYNTETGLMAGHSEIEPNENLIAELQVMADELKAVIGEEGEFISAVHKFGNDEEPDFTVDRISFREHADDAVEGTEEVDGNEDLSATVSSKLNTVTEEKVKTPET